MKTIKYIGLDVHKNSISIATADEGRAGEVRYYGKIGNDMENTSPFPLFDVLNPNTCNG